MAQTIVRLYAHRSRSATHPDAQPRRCFGVPRSASWRSSASGRRLSHRPRPSVAGAETDRFLDKRARIASGGTREGQVRRLQVAIVDLVGHRPPVHRARSRTRHTPRPPPSAISTVSLFLTCSPSWSRA